MGGPDWFFFWTALPGTVVRGPRARVYVVESPGAECDVAVSPVGRCDVSNVGDAVDVYDPGAEVQVP